MTPSEASELIELLTRESSTTVFATEKSQLFLQWKAELDRRFVLYKKDSTTTDALIQARRETIAEIIRQVK